MFNLGAPELILILVIALIVFGPSKLPEVGKSIGKAVNEFKRASRDIQREINQTTQVIKEPEKPEPEKPAEKPLATGVEQE